MKGLPWFDKAALMVALFMPFAAESYLQSLSVHWIVVSLLAGILMYSLMAWICNFGDKPWSILERTWASVAAVFGMLAVHLDGWAAAVLFFGALAYARKS